MSYIQGECMRKGSAYLIPSCPDSDSKVRQGVNDLRERQTRPCLNSVASAVEGLDLISVGQNMQQLKMIRQCCRFPKAKQHAERAGRKHLTLKPRGVRQHLTGALFAESVHIKQHHPEPLTSIFLQLYIQCPTHSKARK